MPGTDNQVIGSRLYGNDDYQTRLRKYAQDEEVFKFFALYQKYDLSVLRVLSEKFGRVPSDQITDFEVKYPEASELEYEFTPNAASTDDDVAKRSLVPIANDLASSLHENHILMVKSNGAVGSTGLYTNATGTALTTTLSATTPIQETCLVETVGQPDSGGAGYTNVTLKRMYPNDAPTAALIQIATTMKLVIVNNISPEDGLHYPPSTKNSDYEYNYIQTTRESYGISSHVKSGIKTFLDKDQLDINLEICSARVMREVETAIIMGRRSKKRRSGKMLYQTGGIAEFIPAANLLNFGAIITPINFRNLVRRIGDTVGSTIQEMWLFGGTEMITKLDNAFEGKVVFSPAEAESIKYQIKVREFTEHATNMRLFIAAAPILNVLGMANEALVLNLSDKYRPFQLAEKEPMSNKPEDGGTLSEKSQYSTLRELYSMWGMIRRLADSHFRIYNFL